MPSVPGATTTMPGYTSSVDNSHQSKGTILHINNTIMCLYLSSIIIPQLVLNLNNSYIYIYIYIYSTYLYTCMYILYLHF